MNTHPHAPTHENLQSRILRRRSAHVALLLSCGLLAVALWNGGTLEAAAPKWWGVAPSPDTYATVADWNPTGIPVATDTAAVGVTTNLNGSVLYDNASYNYGLTILQVGQSGSSCNGTFTMSAGTLGLTNNSGNALVLGNVNTGTGNFVMNGGTLNIQREGAGESYFRDVLSVGNANGATGNLTINSGGTLNCYGGIEIASSGTGTVTVNSGGLIVDNGWFGVARGGGSGALAGTFNLSGGTVYVLRNPSTDTGSFGVAFCQGGVNGTVNISSGTLYASAIRFAAGGSASHSDTETLTVSGGDIYLASSGVMWGAGGGTKTVSISLSGGTFHDLDLGPNTGGTQGLTSVLSDGANWVWGSDAHLAASINTTPGPGVVTFAPSATRTITLSNSFSGLGGLTMSGPGTLAIDGANTYSGNTTLDGGTTAGFGSVQGAVTANSASTIAPGGSITPGTLTLGSASLTLNSDINIIKLSADPSTVGGGVNDLLATTGNLVLQNVSTIKVVPLAPLSTTTPYTVMQYGGTQLLASDAAHLHVISDSLRYSFSVVDPSTTSQAIQINVTGNAGSLAWLGGTAGNPNVWNHTVANWLNLGTSGADVFYNGDTTLFDDRTAINVVTVSGAEQPAVMTMANNTAAYTFNGDGPLSGALDVEGTSSLTLAMSVTPTLLGITNNSGVLIFNLANGVANTISAPISDNGSGGGTIIQAGNNVMALSGDNAAYNGKLFVTNGILQYTATTAVGASGVPLVVTNTGTLDFHHVSVGTKPLIVSGAGYNGIGALTDSGGAGTTVVVQSITLADDATFSALTRWEQPASSTFVGNGHNLTVIGSSAGVILLNGTGDTGLADVNILGTRFGFENNIGLGDSTKTITVDAGATNAILTFFSVVNPMDKKLVLKNNAILDSGGAANTFIGPVTLFATNTVGLRSALHLSGPIGGAGGIIVATNTPAGNGNAGVTLFLEGVNTYSGVTILNQGSTVTLGASAVFGPSSLISLNTGSTLDASALGATDFSLGSGQTLNGIGTVVGPSSANITFGSGSTLSVGLTSAATATLTVNGNVIFQAGSTNAVDVNPGTSAADLVTGLTSVTYGGTLRVNKLGASPYAIGNSFHLFSASTYNASAFNAIIPATPGAGLAWDTNSLPVDGTLKVVAPPEFTDISRLGDGNMQFTFTGTVGDHYTLRATTDLATPLINWDVLSSGTITASPLTIQDLTAANHPQRFYRISDP